MTFLENLKNSVEFPPGTSGTVDSREFPMALYLATPVMFNSVGGGVPLGQSL